MSRNNILLICDFKKEALQFSIMTGKYIRIKRSARKSYTCQFDTYSAVDTAHFWVVHMPLLSERWTEIGVSPRETGNLWRCYLWCFL